MNEVESSIGKNWKSVARPIPNRGTPEVSLMNGPPAIAPKPAVAPKPRAAPEIVTKPDGSKVWAYLYSVPDPQSTSQNGPKIHYPRSDELVKSNKPRLKRIHKYVPTEQTENYNSRGGKMFQKQKKRMNEYVLTAPANYLQTQEDMPIETRQAAQPREYNRHTAAGSKNMPALVNNTMNVKMKKKIKGPVIRPLRSPPPEWRAKVDSGYSKHAPQYRSRRWAPGDYEAGYESAPPEDLIYEDAEFVNDYVGGEGTNVRSNQVSRADSREGPETAVFYFNAKYQSRPHYFRRPYIQRDAFVTTPYSENDFNARPVGWSKAYAEQY